MNRYVWISIIAAALGGAAVLIVASGAMLFENQQRQLDQISLLRTQLEREHELLEQLSADLQKELQATPPPSSSVELQGMGTSSTQVAGILTETKSSAAASPVSSRFYDMAEVARHTTSGDCWLVIRGNIYDVTAFSKKHPGGQSPILNECGKDATFAYDTKGMSPARAHSAFATDMLPTYFVARVGQKMLSSQQTTSSTQKSVATAAATNVASAFVTGQWITLAAETNVRSSPSISAALVGTQKTGGTERLLMVLSAHQGMFGGKSILIPDPTGGLLKQISAR